MYIKYLIIPNILFLKKTDFHKNQKIISLLFIE